MSQSNNDIPSLEKLQKQFSDISTPCLAALQVSGFTPVAVMALKSHNGEPAFFVASGDLYSKADIIHLLRSFAAVDTKVFTISPGGLMSMFPKGGHHGND